MPVDEFQDVSPGSTGGRPVARCGGPAGRLQVDWAGRAATTHPTKSADIAKLILAMPRRLAAPACLVVVLLGSSYASLRAEEPNESFETEVRPLLVERCFECHGPEGKPKGGLRLISREAILKGGDSGPAAVPGQPDQSLLIAAVRYDDEPKMPPKSRLSDRQVAALTRWVAAGLPWTAAPAPA